MKIKLGGWITSGSIGGINRAQRCLVLIAVHGRSTYRGGSGVVSVSSDQGEHLACCLISTFTCQLYGIGLEVTDLLGSHQ